MSTLVHAAWTLLPPPCFPLAALLTSSPLALLVLFDFAAAFPSLAHAYMFRTLKSAGLPPFLLNFFKALYKDNKVLVRIEDQFVFSIYSFGSAPRLSGLGSTICYSAEPYDHNV